MSRSQQVIVVGLGRFGTALAVTLMRVGHRCCDRYQCLARAGGGGREAAKFKLGVYVLSVKAM
jgi:hypothetical protein